MHRTFGDDAALDESLVDHLGYPPNVGAIQRLAGSIFPRILRALPTATPISWLPCQSACRSSCRMGSR
ncbi:hypothetical protein EOA22_11785 [Mesorhizobium sp. M7A.F.Ca.US.014.04.1.1]|nr:hypothetical protein EOC84_06270 [Mesorhizobium sp. Primo-B]RUU40948.1 hypothetical protein EOC83_03085 [Mesorhizobium sp. Primo-A]RUX14584.1 hypothetical protein EN996_16025 [Mesorhizobium sp. M7A.F.Ca.CA.002.14.1.2]RUX39791.1 hypothetical protein EN987_10305 [Mesorhizobium sp. M7A.F.Ca.CA.002.11.2.1]RUX51233.1 hypothetical protein EN994_16925 [Mesorhizobium sp. M7A.F.Ca.CA.002.09.1.1]RUX62972.1 hypothetical protein EN989_02995 [Mesorhizobium sp. M7A.F.Ca.CA.002.12.1.1]RUX65774.1 hypothet